MHIKFKHLFILFLVVAFTGNSKKIFAQGGPAGLRTADSLFGERQWLAAKKFYDGILKDTTQNALEWNRLGFCNLNLQFYDEALRNFKKSLLQHPPASLKAIVYSRMARIFALKNEKEESFRSLDSAVAYAYFNLKEMDSLSDFNGIRGEKRFKDIRQQVFMTVYPCMSNPQAREFDFWVGEWDVFQTGTNFYQGHSLIQLIAGGCAILENWDSQNSSGKSLNFIDPITKKWKQTWAGSYAGGIQEFVNGKYEDSIMHFEFETTDGHGNKISGRFRFYNQGPNQVRQFSETSADGGKTWTTNYDFTYKRKKIS
jgi:tetratricopeptide (TPR) repeat protein